MHVSRPMYFLMGQIDLGVGWPEKMQSSQLNLNFKYIMNNSLAYSK